MSADVEFPDPDILANLKPGTLSASEVEALYRAIINSSPDGILTTDLQGRVRFASPAFVSMLKLDCLDSLIGANVLDWVDPEDKERLSAHIRQAQGGVFAPDSQYHFRTSTGSRLVGEVNSTYLCAGDGAPVGFVVNFRDVTDRWQAFEDLHRSEEMLSSMVRSSPVGMHFYRLEGDDRLVLEAANPAADRILGIDHAPLLGKTLEEAFPPLIDSEVPRHYRQAASQGTQWKTEQITYAFGEVQGIYEVTAYQTQPGHMVAAFSDITARKQADQDLRTSLENLRLLRTIDQGIIDHDDLAASLDALIRPIQEYFQADAAEILFYDPVRMVFQQAAGAGFLSGSYHLPFDCYDGTSGLALRTRKMVRSIDLMGNAELHGDKIFYVHEGFVSGYAVLLEVPNRVQGALQLFYRSSVNLQRSTVDFFEMVGKQVAIAVEKASLWENHQHALNDLAVAYETTLEGWVYALDLRDKETEHHTRRVTELTLVTAQAMGISGPTLVDLRRGALLHDIGKIGIPDHILHKPGPLSSDEWDLMRQHPAYARNMLSSIPYLKDAIEIPYCHHERWNGSGYPCGLQGAAIPLGARIFAVVDAWDALTSDRPYRKAWTCEQALSYIVENAGTLFDPQIVAVFLNLPEIRGGGEETP